MSEQKVTTIIVDDEQDAIDGLKIQLDDFFPEIEVLETAKGIKEAYEKISRLKPSLVFLDINLGSRSSFELLELFEKVDFKIVFITAYEEYAIKAIKVSAIDYVMKPPNISKLKEVITRYRESKHLENHKNVKQMFNNLSSHDTNTHKIALPVQDGTEFRPIDDIIYLLADGSYTKLFFKDGSEMLVSKHLKYFDDLLVDYRFYRIHNSILVNLKCIRKLSKANGGFLIMDDGKELSISKRRKEQFLRVFHSNI